LRLVREIFFGRHVMKNQFRLLAMLEGCLKVESHTAGIESLLIGHKVNPLDIELGEVLLDDRSRGSLQRSI